MMNMIQPALHFAVDDMTGCSASIEKLKSLPISTVYPGHGKPFQLERFMTRYHKEDPSLHSG